MYCFMCNISDEHTYIIMFTTLDIKNILIIDLKLIILFFNLKKKVINVYLIKSN